MKTKVLTLEEVADALEMSDGFTGQYFYNTQTGAFEFYSELISDNDLDFFDDEKYIALPNQVNAYEIMLDFAYEIQDDKIRNTLINALNGKGAFRYFKNTIKELDIEKTWYEYRFLAFIKIAKDWCETHDIDYMEVKK